MPHIREDGTIGLEAAFEDPDQVATAERIMRDIKQKNR
jgi:hypothetical protein